MLKTGLLVSVAAVVAASQAVTAADAASISSFTEGDLVVAVEGDGSGTGSYTDNQAAPLTLYEYGSGGAGFVGSFTLPQSNSARISRSPANMVRHPRARCSSLATAIT